MRLNHVALAVSDRERSASFCAEHFGLDQPVHDDEHLLPDGYRIDLYAYLELLATSPRILSLPIHAPCVEMAA